MTELDFAPDYSPYTPGNIQLLSDLYPTITGSYATCMGPNVEGYATPVAATNVIGSAIVKNKSGTARLYAGTAAKIFQANGTTGWTDRSGAAYSATGWDFVQFGDTTVAASGGDVLQKSTGAAFSDIATAPTAKLVIVHENALLAFNLSTDAAGWARSDTGSTVFTVLPANDADGGTFLNGSGPITAASTFQSLAIAWKGDWMYQGRFTGDVDEKVRWDTVAAGIGCVGQHAHISTEIGLIFVSNRDILLYDGTSMPRSIADKVRKAFLSLLSPTQKASVILTHNEIERNVYIWYPPNGSSAPSRAYIYNYKTGKWGFRATLNTPLTGFDNINCRVVNANYTDYQAVGGMATNTGFESNVVWAGSAITDSRLINYAPSAAAKSSGQSSMTSGYWGQPEKDTRISGARMVYESAPTNTLNAVSVTTYNASLSSSASISGTVDSDGNANFNAENRFHKVLLQWTSQSAGQSNIKSVVPRWYDGGGVR